MPLLETIKGLMNGGKIIESVGGVIDNLTMSKEEKESLKIELAKEINRHSEAAEIEITKRMELEFKDMDSARQMQVEALKQDDKFSKRFVYYLAAFVIVSATLYGGGLFFFHVPEENKRLVEMFADLYMFAGGMMVLNFFFSSTATSREKTRQLIDMSKKE